MLRYCFNILSIVIGLHVFAQPSDSLVLKPDWKPSMFKVGISASRLIGSAIKAERNSFEGALSFDTHNFFIITEAGRETNSRSDNWKYSNSGFFYRVGWEYNFIAHSKDRNVLSMGIRYGRSKFSDKLSFSRTNEVLGIQQFNFKNNSVKTGWFEATSSLKVNLWKDIYMGGTLRIKLFRNNKGIDQLVPYDIPGYGRHRKNGTDVKTTNVGLDYYIEWRIPLRDKPIRPKKIKIRET